MVVSADYEEMYVVVSAFITNKAYSYSKGSHLRDTGLQELIPVPNMSCAEG